jgi:excisionase family DNA binding protein
LTQGKETAAMSMLANRSDGNIQLKEEVILESGRKLARILQHQDRELITLQFADSHESVEVPSRAIALLVNILDVMATGKDAAVVTINEELTTSEAANLLNVSRPFLVKLLEDGVIPHRKIGTHRRILLEDALVYREQDNRSKEEILDQLVQDAQENEMGYGHS